MQLQTETLNDWSRLLMLSTGRMIFLGETFSGFVTVHNDSQQVVKEVILKVRKRTA